MRGDARTSKSKQWRCDTDACRDAVLSCNRADAALYERYRAALDARLADVRRECVSELKATFKETDLFKVFQVPHDLSALEDSAPAVAARVPSLATVTV